MEAGLFAYHTRKSTESLHGGSMTGDMAECMTRKVKTDSPGLPSIGSKNIKKLFSFMLLLIILCVLTLVWEKACKAKPPEISKKPESPEKGHKSEQKLRMKVAPVPAVNNRNLGALIATENHRLELTGKRNQGKIRKPIPNFKKTL